MATEITATVGMRVDVSLIINGHINAAVFTQRSGPGDVIGDSSGEAFVALNDGDGPGDQIVDVALNIDNPNTPDKEQDLTGSFTIRWVPKPVTLATTLDFAATAEMPPA